MPFSRLIYRLADPVADFRIDVPLVVLGSRGALGHPFRLDTGCGITVVSERIARAFGLPNGGRLMRSPHLLIGSGRVVPARFRFPSDPTTGAPGREVASEWLVIPVTYEYARLGFRDVHPHFTVTTDDTFMHFTER